MARSSRRAAYDRLKRLKAQHKGDAPPPEEAPARPAAPEDDQVARLAEEIRRLKSVIEKKDAAIQLEIERGMLRFLDLPWEEARMKFQRKYLKKALEKSHQDLDVAARSAGLAPKAYLQLLEEAGLNVTWLRPEEAPPPPPEARKTDLSHLKKRRRSNRLRRR